MERLEARERRRLLRLAPRVFELPNTWLRGADARGVAGTPAAAGAEPGGAVSADLCGPARARPRVSADLCEPLDTARALGKHFRGIAAGDARAAEPRESRAGERRSQRPRPPRKAWREHRMAGRVLREQLTLWDMLLPVLQPPLALDAAAIPDLPHRLYRYQVDGITFLRDSTSALLADEMGTGKTVMSTVAMRLLFREARIARALVVCPLGLLSVWDRHLAEWAPELSVTVVHGSARTRWADWRCPAHVWITTYDTLRGDLAAVPPPDEPLLPDAVARRFDLVLLDEAQNIKNRDSGRTRAVLALEPRWRWALSGTPIENRLDDLHSLFQFVRPRLLPAEDLTPALATDLIAPYFKRRTKRQVMTELPPKIRTDEWLDMDDAQMRAYRLEEQRTSDELEQLGDRLSRVHVFSMLTRLKTICNFAPGCTDSPKLRSVVDKVEQIRASGHKVLVFTQWVGAGVDPIARALERFGVVTHDARLDRRQRDANIERFRTDPEITAFVATVKSAGVGLTLTEASYVIHFDHWWNPAWMWQAEDRAHRKGQHHSVNVYSLWMRDTVEERVHELLEKKGVLHEEVVDGLSEEAVAGMVSMREWVAVLGGLARRRP